MANNNVFSITEHGRSEPFDLQVARGLVKYHSEINIFGYQVAVGTNQYAVWENVADYVFPTTAQTMNLASDNNADTATILITGLDANYAVISESLVLTGTTAVSTVNSYLRINNMSVSVGSSTNPAGNVTLKNSAGTPNTITYAQINAGVGATQMSIYTVPAGYTFYLSRIDASTSLNGNTAAYAKYRNKNVSSAGVTTYRAQAAFTQTYHIQRVMPLSINEKTDVQFQLATSTGTALMGVFAEGYLIANTNPNVVGV